MTKDDFLRILTEHPDAVGDRQRFSNLLNDYFPQEPKLRRILIFLHELGIHAEIEETEEITKQFAYRLFKRLVDEYDVSNENAYLGVYLWCSSYGGAVLGKKCELIESYADSFPANDTTESSDKKNEKAKTHGKKSREYGDYYVNVAFTKELNRVYVPCSFDEKDYGYYICGIVERKRCKHEHADVFALVYNYVIRNSQMDEDDMPNLVKNMDLPYQLKFENVFRLVTILLQLIKNNYIKDNAVNVNYDGYINELKCAIEIINDYVSLFCRLLDIPKCPALKLTIGKTPINITLTGTRGVYIKKSEDAGNAREIWYGHKITYRLKEKNRQDLEYILTEISPYEKFLPGQFEALCSVLGGDGHMLCQMPRGSGKSLIFYLASLLQPLPIFVVMPNDDMIYEQIQSLKNKHRIDNVTHLYLTQAGVFSDFEMWNNLIFLTPVTFQNRALLERFRLINEEMQISYVVLDEISCLSDHEPGFRPECLMLCARLDALIERVVFLGFTETGSGEVIDDIKRYLAISPKNIIAPLGHGGDEKAAAAPADEYDFEEDKDKMIAELIEYYQDINGNERAAFMATYAAADVAVVKRFLYILFIIGYIEDWYIMSPDEHGDTVNVMIVISASEDLRLQKDGGEKMLWRVRKKTLAYFRFIGGCDEQIKAIRLAENMEEIIGIFAGWYYMRFLFQ